MAADAHDEQREEQPLSTSRGSAEPRRRRHRRYRRSVVAAVTVALVAISTTVIAASVATTPADVNRANAPDLVLYDGAITTVDASNSEFQAIAIRDGKILAVGNSGPIRALANPQKTELIDLDGRRVLPGLIDGHIHGLRNAYHCYTQTVRLDLVTSRDEALAAYEAKADELANGLWIFTSFGGWNVNQLDTPEIFTFDELTAAAPDNPVWITGSGFNGPRVNQAALDALGLAPGDAGVGLDGDGNPTGLLTGPASGLAADAIYAQLDTLGIEGEAECLADFIRDANRRGLTAWKDAEGNRFPWDFAPGEISRDLHVHQPAMHLYRESGLDVRIAFHQMSDYRGPEQVFSDTRNAIGFLGDDMLRYLGPGEDTMADDPGYSDFTTYAAEKRLSVETHVGEHDAILDGFEVANAVYPISDLTWSISHPDEGEPTDEQLARASNLGIGYTLTFSSVRNGGDGPRFRSTMESGVHMCLASDALNVSPWAPFQNLWYVTTGDTLLPGVPGVPEDQQLTRDEALRHATVECAWNMAQEDRLGSLEVGKHADLIVLSDDYFTVPDDAIKDITSVLTIVDGRVVFAEGDYAHLGP